MQNVSLPADTLPICLVGWLVVSKIYRLLTSSLVLIIFRTLPAKYLEKIADQMRTYNINALMVIGGFEVHCLVDMLVYPVGMVSCIYKGSFNHQTFLFHITNFFIVNFDTYLI